MQYCRKCRFLSHMNVWPLESEMPQLKTKMLLIHTISFTSLSAFVTPTTHTELSALLERVFFSGTLRLLRQLSNILDYNTTLLRPLLLLQLRPLLLLLQLQYHCYLLCPKICVVIASSAFISRSKSTISRSVDDSDTSPCIAAPPLLGCVSFSFSF